MKNKIFTALFSLVVFLGFGAQTFASISYTSNNLIDSTASHVLIFENKNAGTPMFVMGANYQANGTWSEPQATNQTLYVLSFNAPIETWNGGNPNDLIGCFDYNSCKTLANGFEATYFWNNGDQMVESFIDLGAYTLQTQQQILQTSLFATGGLTASVAQTKQELGGITTRSVSNLWPIILIIIGIVLTFYVLEKIISMFQKNTKEKKYSSDVMRIYREGKGGFDKK